MNLHLRKFVFICVIVLSTVSCSSKWERIGNLSENFDIANVNCQRISQNKFPVRNEVAQETIYKPRLKFCEDKKECDGKKYKIHESQEIRSYSIDVNEISRNKIFDSCMKKSGWKKTFFLI